MDSSAPKTSARDFFLYLLVVGTLYVCVWRFLDLVFEYINVSFPDSVEMNSYDGNWGYWNSLRSIRTSMATLIIIFPIYLGLSWFLRKDTIAHEEKRRMWIRKWLLNLTLFLAAVMMIADLVTLVNYFLQGELTIRFFLKVLTVLVVAVAVFGYYLWDLRREVLPASKPSYLLIAAAALVVFGSIGAGFFITGSPETQRMQRFDEQRVQHLQTLQSNIVDFWQRKEVLPVSLEDLRSDLTGCAPPEDPETLRPYGYAVKGNLVFELCADFALASKQPADYTIESKPVPVGGAPWETWNWLHPAGRHCFERTIAPDLFPPYSKTDARKY